MIKIAVTLEFSQARKKFTILFERQLLTIKNQKQGDHPVQTLQTFMWDLVTLKQTTLSVKTVNLFRPLQKVLKKKTFCFSKVNAGGLIGLSNTDSFLDCTVRDLLVEGFVLIFEIFCYSNLIISFSLKLTFQK